MVFVIDVSGSMRTGNIIEPMKLEFDKTIQQLQDWQFFSMVKFNGEADYWMDHLVEVNDANIQLARTWVRELTGYGSTKYGPALEKAYGMQAVGVHQHTVKLNAIFLLSDGEPSDCSTKPLVGCYQDKFDLNPDVKIRTIALNAPSSAQDLLRNIADETGGKYIQSSIR